ncbi:hypothetical protein EDD85DRAFT_962273 [Armillaria nabsnona]|nr:hypothetical protein EDD85DRAFT_962273 [Armillaria nabsnona]
MNESKHTRQFASKSQEPKDGLWLNIDELVQTYRTHNETEMIIDCAGFKEHAPISSNCPVTGEFIERISVLVIKNEEGNIDWISGDLIYLLAHLPKLEHLTIEEVVLDNIELNTEYEPLCLGISLNILHISSCTNWESLICLLTRSGVNLSTLERIDIAGPWFSYAENPQGNPVTPDPASNLGEILEQGSTS